jgi:nitrogenase iron protein NifH
MPIREGVADQVYTVSSSDFMAVYAANNLFKGIKKYANNGGGLFSGIIANSMNLPVHKEIIEDFSKKTKTTIADFVPRSLMVTKSELRGKTVIEAAPDSEQADVYRKLAQKIFTNENKYVPVPLEVDELKEWAESWSDKLLEDKETQKVDCSLECIVPGGEERIATDTKLRNACKGHVRGTKKAAASK